MRLQFVCQDLVFPSLAPLLRWHFVFPVGGGGQTGRLFCLYGVTPDARQLCEPSAGDLLASVVICVASAGKMIFAHSGQFVYRPTVGSLLASVAISGLTAAYKSVGAILDR